MTPLLLIIAAFAAGVMNSVAGGGSLLTFPALVFGGVPPVIANASSTVALFPGSFASAWAYRRDFKPVEGVALAWLIAASLAGGVAGAFLLLFTPESYFDAIVPWLLLAATLLFAFGRQATPVLQRLFRIGPKGLVTIQFVVAVYGGYFGGAVGILQLAVYGLFGLTDLNAMNANKTLLTGTMNAIAVVVFIIAGKVWWIDTLLMLGGAVLGGYAGARVGRRIDPRILRVVITAIGLVMTAVFFVRR
jgi:uncharacterized membrane protein YfcA